MLTFFAPRARRVRTRLRRSGLAFRREAAAGFAFRREGAPIRGAGRPAGPPTCPKKAQEPQLWIEPIRGAGRPAYLPGCSPPPSAGSGAGSSASSRRQLTW